MTNTITQEGGRQSSHDTALAPAIDAPALAPQPMDEAAAMISMIERVVMDKDMPLERLEKMIELKERYDDREAEKSFKEALAQAKMEFKPIFKRRDGHNSKYADLFDVADSVDDALSKHGFSYGFETSDDGEKVRVSCVLSHKDGHSKTTPLSAKPDTSGSKNAIQAMGSTITYLERYTLSAALGLAAGQDTDGMTIPNNELINEQQFSSLQRSIDEGGIDVQALCTYLDIPSIKEMPLIKFHTAVAAIEAKRKSSEAADA